KRSAKRIVDLAPTGPPESGRKQFAGGSRARVAAATQRAHSHAPTAQTGFHGRDEEGLMICDKPRVSTNRPSLLIDAIEESTLTAQPAHSSREPPRDLVRANCCFPQPSPLDLVESAGA